jgi:hypothetical protein
MRKPLMVYLMILAVLDMVHRSERTGYDAVVMDQMERCASFA